MSISEGGQPTSLSEPEILDVLRKGRLQERGLLPYSSNYSFLVTVETDEHSIPAVYKPRRGESPLWDFTSGTLCQRELAAYLVSSALDWQLVPPTVLRKGEYGIGSVQFYVDHDEEQHYFTVQNDARFTPTLRRLALFDYVVNNADRKSGHCLAGRDQRLWAIDHGICFHSEYKLRTVVWEFSAQEIEDELRTDLQRLHSTLACKTEALTKQLNKLLDAREFCALTERLERLLQAAVYPSPAVHRRNYPWPPV